MELGTVLIEKHNPTPPRGGRVIEEAIARGWIRVFAQGQYVYTPRWTNLLRCLQDAIRRHALAELGFEEWLFPRVIPRQALDSFNMTQFAERMLLKGGGGADYLDPVQCVSIYQSLRDTKIDVSVRPLRIVECLGGWTWRNETEETLDGPYRAREFLRVEHVYIGSPAVVTQTRRQVRDGLLGLLDRLGLSYQVVVGAACMELPSIKERQLAARQADDIPVQDIEVPIRGALRRDPGRDKLKNARHAKLDGHDLRELANDEFYLDTDEICGCSVEGDRLIKRFGIQASDGGELWSGCVGIGLNRLVLGFLYQHGFDSERWPDLENLGPGRRAAEVAG
jgi:seryl-tRNA synthetase